MRLNILQGPGCPSPADNSLAPNVNSATSETPPSIVLKANERNREGAGRSEVAEVERFDKAASEVLTGKVTSD